MWCGNYEATENGYTIIPADYNRNLTPGASVNVGFLAEGDDAILEELATEAFFQHHGVYITTAEERKNMPTIFCKNLTWHSANSLILDKRQLRVEGKLDFRETCVSGKNGGIRVSGDFHSDRKCEFNAFHLDIGGDFTLDEGRVSLEENTKATIAGDVLLSGSGCIDTSGEAYKPELHISGNLLIDSQEETTLQKGELFLKGDLIQTEESEKDSLEASDDFTLHFTGSAPQKISLASPSSILLGIMDYQKSAGIEIPDEIHGTNIIGFEKIKKKEQLDLYLSGLKLKQNETILCENTVIHTGGLRATSYDLTVQGNLSVKEDVLSAYKESSVTVNGNLHCDVRSILLTKSQLRVRKNFYCKAVYSEITSDSCIQINNNFYCDMERDFSVTESKLQVDGDLLVDKGKAAFYGGNAQVIVAGNAKLAQEACLYTDKSDIFVADFAPKLWIYGNLIIDSLLETNFCLGTLTLGGDFLQTEDSAEDSLQISSSFHLILNGKKEQTVSLWDDSLCIENLDISESAGVYFDQYEISGDIFYGLDKLINDSDLVLSYHTIYLMADHMISGNLEINGNLDMIWHSLTIHGDLCQNGDISNIGNLTVDGNFQANTGTIDLWAGTIQVGKNFSIKKKALLSMSDKEGLLSIDGNLKFDSEKQSELLFGTIRLKGNLISIDNGEESELKIIAAEFIFCGTKEQTIDTERIILFHALDMTESTGVFFKHNMVNTKYIYGFRNINNPYLEVRNLILLPNDDDVFHGSLVLRNSSADLQGNTFQVNGDLELENVSFNVGGGKLKIYGELQLLADTILIMQNPEDFLYVKGDFTTESEISHEGFLTAGEFELYGDFSQAGNPRSFCTTESFQMVFAGEEKQKAHWENPLESTIKNIKVTGAGYSTSDELDVRIGGLLNAFRLGMEDGLVELIEQDPGSIAVTIGGTVLLSSSTIGRIILAVMAVVFTGLVLVEMTLTTASLQNMYVKAREYGKEAFMLLLCVVACKQIEGELASDAERIQAALKSLGDKEYVKGLLTDIWAYMKKTPENLRTNLANFKQWMNTQAGKRMVARYLKDIIKNTEDILDEEARAYLTEQFENSSQYHKLKKLIQSAESAKEVKGNVLNQGEIRYINNALAEDVPQESINERILSGVGSKVFTSRDPLVGEIATELERLFPGRVMDVNRLIYRPNGEILTDIDIELDTITIEVKSKAGNGLTEQLIKSANETGKTAVGYAPKIKKFVLKDATEHGFKVFRNMEDLIEFVRNN